jgi:hypothetical protein
MEDLHRQVVDSIDRVVCEDIGIDHVFRSAKYPNERGVLAEPEVSAHTPITPPDSQPYPDPVNNQIQDP